MTIQFDFTQDSTGCHFNQACEAIKISESLRDGKAVPKFSPRTAIEANASAAVQAIQQLFTTIRSKAKIDDLIASTTLTITLVPTQDNSYDMYLKGKSQLCLKGMAFKHAAPFLGSLKAPPSVPARLAATIPAPTAAPSMLSRLTNLLPASIATTDGVGGIPNRGNTCFINAAFQMIMNDQVLCQAIVEAYKPLVETYSLAMKLSEDQIHREDAKNHHDAYKCFVDAVEQYQKGNSKTIDLNPLRFLLKIYAPKNGNVEISGWRLGSLGDANEMIYALLEPIAGKFGFRIGYERTYQIEGIEEPVTQSNENPNEKLSIILPLDMKNLQGTELVNQFFIGGPQDSSAELGRLVYEKPILSQSPDRLIIQLKRFTLEKKIDDALEMPLELTIQGQKYNLKSIVQHGGVHYWAYVLKNGAWFKADDSTISSASDLQNGLKKGYLYFYEKV